MIRNYDNWRSLNESKIHPDQRVLLDLGLLDLTQDQIYWLEWGTEGTWTLNEETGLVDIDGSFYFGFKDLTDLCGLRFGRVTGSFDCSGNNITSLRGAPRWVGGSFWCNRNELTSLVGAPEYVGREFDCSHNQLTSLEGAPNEVGGDFWCCDNYLTQADLEYLEGRVNGEIDFTPQRKVK